MADLLTTENGSIEISPEAINKIIALSLDNIHGFVPIKHPKKDIQIEMEDQSLAITLSISIVHGHRIPDVCDAIRSSIKTSLEDISGLTATTIDINIVGIDTKHSVSVVPPNN